MLPSCSRWNSLQHQRYRHWQPPTILHNVIMQKTTICCCSTVSKLSYIYNQKQEKWSRSSLRCDKTERVIDLKWNTNFCKKLWPVPNGEDCYFLGCNTAWCYKVYWCFTPYLWINRHVRQKLSITKHTSASYSPILTRQEHELLQYEYRTGCNTENKI